MVSSSLRSRSVRTSASYASQLRAALPVPPYTTRSSGRSATSGSRLFMSMRSAASCCQPLQEIEVPRGACTRRDVEPRGCGTVVVIGLAELPIGNGIRQGDDVRGQHAILVE